MCASVAIFIEGEKTMQTQRQTLDLSAPPAWLIANESGPPLPGGRASKPGRHKQTGFTFGKVGLMLSAILLLAYGASAQPQAKATEQYRVAYLDSLGGTNGRG